MFVGIVLLILWFFLTVWVCKKIHSKKIVDESLAPELFCFLLFIFFIISLPVVVTKFVEFPSIFGEPTIATFDESGNLIYHKWGLLTPPGLEVVNAQKGEVWEIAFLGSGTPVLLISKGGEIHRVGFWIKMKFEDPKLFFAKKDRRKQGVGPLGVFSDKIKRDFVGLLASKYSFLGDQYTHLCGFKSQSCPQFDRLMENQFQETYKNEGVRVLINTYSDKLF